MFPDDFVYQLGMLVHKYLITLALLDLSFLANCDTTILGGRHSCISMPCFKYISSMLQGGFNLSQLHDMHRIKLMYRKATHTRGGVIEFIIREKKKVGIGEKK